MPKRMSFTPFDRSVPQGTAPRAIWSLSPVVTDAAGDHGSKSEKRTGGGFVAQLCSSVLSYWYSASSYACSTDPSDTVSVRWIKQVEIETIHFRSVLPAIFRSESIAQPATMDHECGDQSQIGDVAIQDEVATYSIAGRYASGRSWSMIGSVVCVLSSTSTVSLSPSTVSLSTSTRKFVLKHGRFDVGIDPGRMEDEFLHPSTRVADLHASAQSVPQPSSPI
jgi:hypothetical protein